MPPQYPENGVTAYIVLWPPGPRVSGDGPRDPLRVVAFNTAEGWSRDVSEEIAYDVLDRAYDADTTLSAGAKRFIDLHVTTGVKRPPAPSVLREQIQSARKKA